MMMVVIIIITLLIKHLFLVLICVSKVTLDSIGNAKDATMRVFHDDDDGRQHHHHHHSSHHHPDGHHHLFLVLICISKVTLDSICNAKDATMRVFITGLILITVIIISH